MLYSSYFAFAACYRNRRASKCIGEEITTVRSNMIHYFLTYILLTVHYIRLNFLDLKDGAFNLLIFICKGNFFQQMWAMYYVKFHVKLVTINF